MDIRSKVTMLYSLEELSSENSCIHSIHPLAKLLVSGVYLICVVSVAPYDFSRLAAFLFYPVVVMALADIPFKKIVCRAAMVLPFCLIAGIGNLLFDTKPLLVMGPLVVTGGEISLLTLSMRAMLCACAVLILVAVTPFCRITEELRRLHIPAVFVATLEMTYRYIGVLVDEADNMVTAYRLRGNGARWPDVRQFGPFVGQLLIRSMHRAERVYQAMQCRLYAGPEVRTKKQRWKRQDWCFLLLGAGTTLLFRFADFAACLGGWLW